MISESLSITSELLKKYEACGLPLCRQSAWKSQLETHASLQGASVNSVCFTQDSLYRCLQRHDFLTPGKKKNQRNKKKKKGVKVHSQAYLS